MKSLLKILLPVCMYFTLIGANCNKDKDPIDQLPPETQTGANTFGCLINGQVFKPKSMGGLSPILTCFYQYIYASPRGYVFSIEGTKEGSNCELTSIGIGADSVKMEEGKKYMLSELQKGMFTGQLTYSPGCTFPLQRYATSGTNNGELYIKKFDEVNLIVSGTFWFTAINSVGDTARVTDGRFDMKYTR